MVVKIENSQLVAIFQGIEKGKSKYEESVKKRFRKTILMLQNAESITEIRKFRGLNFEALKGNLKGKYSVRVDIKYRIILRVEKDRILVEDILIIEDLTNHYS
jgi:proteic killer suppression protein